jgi:hypothetical protein
MYSVMVTAGRRLTNNDKHQRLRETEAIVQSNQERVAGEPVAVEDVILTAVKQRPTEYLIDVINWRRFVL